MKFAEAMCSIDYLIHREAFSYALSIRFKTVDNMKMEFCILHEYANLHSLLFKKSKVSATLVIERSREVFHFEKSPTI